MIKGRNFIAIAIGLLWCLPSSGEDKQQTAINEARTANIIKQGVDVARTSLKEPTAVDECVAHGSAEDYACGAITHQLKLIRDDQLGNQAYTLYRYEDTKREKTVGTLEVREGQGYLQKINSMTLSEAEQVWGKSRDNIIHVSPTLPDGMVEPDRKIFDLVAIGTNRHPMFFYIVAKFEDGHISEYTVDGPGIRRLDPKHIDRL